MLTELQLQAKLVEAVRDIGGYGYKQSNKFLAGPPDLYLSHQDTGTVFIEVKLNDKTQKHVLLTPLQEETIKRMKKAGSKCGVVVLIAMPEIIGEYDIFFTADPTTRRLDSGEWHELHKKRGEKWPILEMMRLCVA